MSSLNTIPSPILSHNQVILPRDMVVSEGDVHITVDSLICHDPVVDTYHGVYRGQPARYTEKRQLSCYDQAELDVRSVGVSNL